MKLTVIIKKGEKQYVALCPELNVVSQGHTIEEAIVNLKEAIELHIEVMGLPEGIGNEEVLNKKVTTVVPLHDEIDRGHFIGNNQANWFDKRGIFRSC